MGDMMNKFTVDEVLCKGCSLCVDACPKKILRLAPEKLNAKGYLPVEITDEAACNSCAFCAVMCPDSVIVIKK